MTDVIVDSLLRVVAVLVAAMIVVSAMRRSSASLRALALTATLAGVLVLPLISLAAPPLEVAVFPAVRHIDPTVMIASTPMPVIAERMPVERNTLAIEELRTTVAPGPELSQQATVDAVRDAGNVSHSNAIGEVRDNRVMELTAWFTSRISITALLVGTWMFGALLFLGRLAVGHRRLDDLVSSATNANSDWHATVDAIRGELGIRRRVDVRTSNDIDIPAVAGVFMPILLVPASIDWSAGEKRDVALHELAHVARWDALAQLLSNVACAVYWFVPLTWYAARHAAALREQACDNVVLRAGTRPSLYAQRLLNFSNTPMSTTLEPVALAMARPAHIQRRVLDILDTRTRRTRLSASFTTTFTAAALAAVALIAVVEPVAASEPLQESRTPVASAPSVPSALNAAVAASVAPVGTTVALSKPSPAPSSAPSSAKPNARASTGERIASAIGVPDGVAMSPTLSSPGTPVSLTSAEIPFSFATAPSSDVMIPVVVPTHPIIEVAKAPAQQQTFVICKDGTKNHQIHSNSSGSTQTWRLTVDGPGCDISIRIEGKPTFNREFTDVERISGRGTFEIDVRQDGVRRELRIRDDDGRISRTWRVDGRERPYDAEAAAWFQQVLIAVDRSTAFAVDVRLPRLLERGGVNAVLAETGQMTSDHARTTYYKSLSKARRLTSQEVSAVLSQGAELTKSDYYATELLKSVGSQGLADPTVRNGVMQLISRMNSDYYRSESIRATVNAGRPTANEVGLLVDVVGKMTSDYYRAETIKLLTSTADLSASQLGEVLSIASKMKSDHHINEMLGSVVARGALDADKRIAYLTATRAIDSDYQRAEAVGKLLRNGPPMIGEMDLLFTTISEIGSDHHKGEVLDRLLAVRALREADLLRAEEVARRIDSDHTQSEVLRRIGSHAAATDAVRSAVRNTAESLSRHYREQVLRGVER